jgi:hypothetical protein
VKERLLDTRIYVCTHKKYNEISDPLYHSLHVGKAISDDLGYPGDDSGENISAKNKSYCELTGIYWLWKNISCDIIGICHYRRFFTIEKEPVNAEFIEDILCQKSYDIILPTCSSSPYASNYEHYKNKHVIKDFDTTRDVILEKHPDYVKAFDLMTHTNLASLGNMIITRKEIFDDYCVWLFDVLFEVEKRTDISTYDDFQKRIYGYLSERLLRVYIYMHPFNVFEIPVSVMQ